MELIQSVWAACSRAALPSHEVLLHVHLQLVAELLSLSGYCVLMLSLPPPLGLTLLCLALCAFCSSSV